MTPEKRIEEVLGSHVFDGCDYCGCGERFGRGDYPAHVAGAVVQALGLKQESSFYEKFETKSESGGEGNMRWGGQKSRSLGWRTSTRLVSEWAEQ